MNLHRKMNIAFYFFIGEKFRLLGFRHRESGSYDVKHSPWTTDWYQHPWAYGRVSFYFPSIFLNKNLPCLNVQVQQACEGLDWRHCGCSTILGKLWISSSSRWEEGEVFSNQIFQRYFHRQSQPGSDTSSLGQKWCCYRHITNQQAVPKFESLCSIHK